MALVRPDDRAFFDACLARLDDPLPRLIWADYLDETDRPQAAAYMRGERGAALLTAAAERVQAGGDADRIVRIVLWLARGGQIADAVDRAAASEDAVQTMRLALRLVEGGQRRFDDSVTLLKVGMHAAYAGAARAVRYVAGTIGGVNRPTRD
jgi:uncharacterized protein (TIGR02996 family)